MGWSRLPTRSRSNRNLMLATLSGIGAHGKKLSGTAPANERGADSVFECDASPSEFPRRSLKARQRRGGNGGGNSDDGFLGRVPLCWTQRFFGLHLPAGSQPCLTRVGGSGAVTSSGSLSRSSMGFCPALPHVFAPVGGSVELALVFLFRLGHRTAR
jgi:hypothetical protein